MPNIILAVRAELQQEGLETLESFLDAMPTYNMFDLFKFAFEEHVNDELRTTEEQLNHPLNFIVSDFHHVTDSTWHGRLENSDDITDDEYVAVGMYVPADGEDQDDSLVPRGIFPFLSLIMNAANNLAVVLHHKDLTGNLATSNRLQDVKVLGRILEQVYQFVTCACDSAWRLGCMTPDFVPYDVYQFLDLYHKFGVIDRRLIRKAGAEDRYHARWDEELRKYSSHYWQECSAQ